MRSLKTMAVLCSTALVMGAMLGAPAEAKKKKKKKKPPACATYTPSTWSADLPVEKITDAATAEAPLEFEIEVPAGAGSSSANSPDDGDGATSHAFLNLQVDTDLPSVGLYGELSYTPTFDYDFFVRNTEGLGLAYSAGFAPGVPLLDGTGHGGHTGVGTENVEGLTTADCTGYLIDVAGATTPGETVTVKLWLGEATYAPE